MTLAGSGPPRTLKLAVERVNLYLFRTGAAILVVEVLLDHPATGQRWRLSDVQDFHEQFRRAYIPFANKHGNPVPDMVVCRVTWHRADDARSFEITADTLKGMIGQYLKPTERDPPTRLKRRSPPLFEHWQWLLENALPLANARREVDGAAWHHVVDERMPTIATISVTPPADSALNKLHYFNATHQGDLIRLCFADAAGSDLFPYDRDSLRDFDKDHTYRAFHHQGTLFMISGYAFVAYGADGFFDEVVAPIHMRRHYFQIGLLAHLELASLLSFSSRISR